MQFLPPVKATPRTPCMCGSEKPFVRCCGVLLRRKDVFIVVSPPPADPPEYFVLGNLTVLYVDDLGRVPVFRTRAQVLRLREDTQTEDLLGCMGFTPKAWDDFRASLAQANLLWFEVPASILAA